MSTRPTAFLGIDVGSSELRAGLVTADGQLLGLERAKHDMAIDGARGFAEQDAGDWWAGMVTTTRELLTRVDADVVGVAVDGHGPTVTAVDRLGRPTRSAITWLDRRAVAEQMELAAATGLRGWSLGILPAALWLERHEPETAARTSWYLNTWEALAARLTGVARTSLVPGQSWPAPDLVAALGLPASRIADPIAAGAVVGPMSAESAEALGLPPGIPVIAGVVDAFASFHGAGIQQPGDAIDVGGSAGGFGVYWDRPLEAAGSFTTPAPLPGLFVIGGAMATIGKSVEWLRDAVLGGERTVDQLIDEASQIEPGADGLIFLPYLAGERSPIWDPDARGAFVGLSLRHGRAHLARAVLEATALALRHVAAPIVSAGVTVSAMRVAGGPARNDAWNQIKADVTGFPVEVPRILETGVVGSAILAAVGTGFHPDLQSAMAAMVTIERRLEPNPAHAAQYERTYAAYTTLHPAISSALRAAGSAAERSG
ncbi:MAG: FGGY-family carbohydrate kinase [Candidatus Limnocylindrales bacterium]